MYELLTWRTYAADRICSSPGNICKTKDTVVEPYVSEEVCQAEVLVHRVATEILQQHMTKFSYAALQLVCHTGLSSTPMTALDLHQHKVRDLGVCWNDSFHKLVS